MSVNTWRPHVISVSPNRDYLAHSGPDGCLKIWEIATGIVKVEYTPSSHLSASLTCLSWSQCKHKGLPKRKKHKPVNYIEDVLKELNLIAMGTSSGGILLYSVAKSDLHIQLDGGHSAAVNDIKWHTDSDSLYSCSSDHHIVQWTLSSGSIKHKWKADKTSIYSISILNTTNILTASCIIKWWDLTTMTVLKKFIGHKTEVFSLLLANSLEGCNLYSDYFISAAIGDRIINVWALKTDRENSAVSSFILCDEPVGMDISCSLDESQCIVAAVTRSGILHVYEYHLNRKCKMQLNPNITIQIISEGNTEQDKKPKPIPILAAQLCDMGQTVIVSYGNFIKPTFEKICLQGCRPEIWLIRKESLTSLTVENSISKIKQPKKPNDVKMLVPGYVILSGPTECKPQKRKKAIDNSQPLEEKLNALSIGNIQELQHFNTAALFENLIHLLVQGLQSKDSHLLNSVLQRGDEKLIRNTIRKLPLSCITMLLDELYKMLHYNGQKNYCLKWLRQVLFTHMSYLMSCQDIENLLGPIYYMLEARTETFSDVSNLSGCLDHLLTQVDAEANKTIQNTAESLLVHEESSSDEEMELISSHTE